MLWIGREKEDKKKVDQEGLLYVISTCSLVGERLSSISQLLLDHTTEGLEQEVSKGNPWSSEQACPERGPSMPSQHSQTMCAWRVALLSWGSRQWPRDPGQFCHVYREATPVPTYKKSTMIIKRFNQSDKPCLTAHISLPAAKSEWPYELLATKWSVPGARVSFMPFSPGRNF